MDNELQLLSDYIRRETGHSGQIDADEDLLASEILDSFNIVSLAVFAQEQFGVEFEAEELTRENLARLSRLAALIRQKRAENSSRS